MRIGILTGGGDAQGLNAVIRAVVKRASDYGFEVYGIRYGWRGLLEGEMSPLRYDEVSGILSEGGTVLKTSRTNPFRTEGGPAKVLENLRKFMIEALIAVGGDDTLSVAYNLSKMGVKVVGVPKTIDNDVPGTDFSFGFFSAVEISARALEQLFTTAKSHDRVIVVEVMGRSTGWIALFSGMAGGANYIIIPEEPFDLDEVCALVSKRRLEGKNFAVIVAAEGAKIAEKEVVFLKESEVDQFGHVRLGGIGQFLAQEIEKRTGIETRSVALGHVVRGGSPSSFDRILATRFGLAAVDLVKAGKFGKMVGLRSADIVPVDLEDAVSGLKTVDRRLYDSAKVFFG